MDNDILIQKLKLGNILYQQLKYALQMVVLCVVCGTTSAELNSKYFRILLYATILCTLFNIVSHLYLQFIRKDFPRLEYFLIYAFNGFLFIAQLVYSMQTVFQIQDDQIGPLVLTKSTIFLLLQRELEILLIMVFPLEIGNRQANSCTTNLIVFLLLASNDPISCSQAADLPLTIVALVNLLGLIMTTLFNLVLFKYTHFRRELRNFINLTTTLIVISQAVAYIQSFISLSSCPFLSHTFQTYHWIAPIQLFSVGFVIAQEIFHTKELMEKEQLILANPKFKQNQQNSLFFHVNYNKQINFQNNNLQSKKLNSLRSQQSKAQFTQQGPESSLAIAKLDEVKEQQHKVLEKKDTGQFGASQHQFAGGMLHSWANVQNANPFFGEAESQIAVPVDKTLIKEQTEPKSQSRSGKQPSSYEEKDESFHVANPMESGSNLTVH